jgi:hypothetical protein
MQTTNFKEVRKYEDSLESGKSLCVCSHKQLIPPNKDSEICTYCGRTIKNTSKARFRYVMFNMMRKED